MKKIMVLAIIALIVASCLFPPWQTFHRNRKSVKYGFIAIPPHYQRSPFDSTRRQADTIDLARFGIQTGLLLFLGICLVASKHIFPKPGAKDE